ncbi:CoA-binding protein [Bacillaceae bacterium]
MPFQNPSKEELKKILTEAKTIAVVGLSEKPERDSYQVAKYLQEKGYKIIPVNPTVDSVLGEKAVSSLKDIQEAVDVVDVFRRPEHVMPVAEEAVAIGAKVLWLQLGVVNGEAAEYAAKHGLKVVMDRCIKVDHAALLG